MKLKIRISLIVIAIVVVILVGMSVVQMRMVSEMSISSAKKQIHYEGSFKVQGGITHTV